MYFRITWRPPSISPKQGQRGVFVFEIVVLRFTSVSAARALYYSYKFPALTRMVCHRFIHTHHSFEYAWLLFFNLDCYCAVAGALVVVLSVRQNHVQAQQEGRPECNDHTDDLWREKGQINESCVVLALSTLFSAQTWFLCVQVAFGLHRCLYELIVLGACGAGTSVKY